MTDPPVTPASVQVPADDSAPITLDFTSHALRVALTNQGDVTALSKLAWDQPGVYVLIGEISSEGATSVYVGKATSLRARLLQHRNKPPIDWWRAVAVARDTTDGFHSAQIGYLEGRLASQLRAAPGLEVTEGQKNIDKTLPDHQLISLDAFLPTIVAALRIAGLDAATEEEGDSEAEESDRHTKRHYGVSLAELTSAGSLKPGAKLVFDQRGAKAEAVINANGEIVLDGVAYDSPSGAASKVLDGQPINGWEAWQLGEDGPTLKELRDRFMEEREEGQPRGKSTTSPGE